MKRVAILGAGGMGSALALLFARTTESVHVWGRDPGRVLELARSRENIRHLPGVPLSENIRFTADASEALAGSELAVVAIPSAYLRQALAALVAVVPSGLPFLSVVKGIENQTFARPSQIISGVLGERAIAVLSGPSHAEELARGLPASVVIAGPDDDLNVRARDALNHGMFRVYTNPDAVGVYQR